MVGGGPVRAPEGAVVGERADWGDVGQVWRRRRGNLDG